MSLELPIADCRLPIVVSKAARGRSIRNPKSEIGNARAFTLVEVLIVVTLLSFIIIALMGVFGATQRAFRASITQTDVLESGRAAMGLINGDLREMKPSGGAYLGAVNFYVGSSGNPPLVQSLIASSGSRTNVQQTLFILSQGNLNGVPTWYGTGYAVWLTPSNTYSLYRFTTNHPVARVGAAYDLFNTSFINFQNSPDRYSHLVDGVVGFRIRAFDPDGAQITYTVTNSIFTNSFAGQPQIYFFSNAIPAAVEIEMATLEDRALQRAESRPYGTARNQYLQEQAGKLHVFRQRIAIPNVVPAAYP